MRAGVWLCLRMSSSMFLESHAKPQAIFPKSRRQVDAWTSAQRQLVRWRYNQANIEASAIYYFEAITDSYVLYIGLCFFRMLVYSTFAWRCTKCSWGTEVLPALPCGCERLQVVGTPSFSGTWWHAWKNIWPTSRCVNQPRLCWIRSCTFMRAGVWLCLRMSSTKHGTGIHGQHDVEYGCSAIVKRASHGKRYLTLTVSAIWCCDLSSMLTLKYRVSRNLMVRPFKAVFGACCGCCSALTVVHKLRSHLGIIITMYRPAKSNNNTYKYIVP